MASRKIIFFACSRRVLRNFAANISVEFHDSLFSVCWKSFRKFPYFTYKVTYVTYERTRIRSLF